MLLEGVTGVAIVAPSVGFVGSNVGVIANPEAQNILLAQQTVDPLPEVFEAEAGIIENNVIEVQRVSRNGFNEDGERYVVPVDLFSGVPFEYVDGESPRTLTATIEGESRVSPVTDFTAAFYDGNGAETRSQVFFGRGTPGQLGTAQGVNGPEQRIYSLRSDPFLGSATPILAPSVATLFDAPPDISLKIIEEPEQGLFRNGAGTTSGLETDTAGRGFAKAGLGALTIEGTGSAQRSLFVVGTGRITPTSDNAPSPDIGIYGSFNDGSATTDTLESNATLLAFGDGSTLIGANAENLVLASASRFIFDTDEDYEVTPVVYNSWEGPQRDARGFAHVGDLASQAELVTSERLSLGQSYVGAVADNPGVFIGQNDDTAFTGGYAAALGRSRVDGETSEAYIIHSDGEGVRMAFDASQNEANAALTFTGGPSTVSIFDGEDTREVGNGINADPDIASGSFGFGSASTRSTMASDSDFLLRNKTSQAHNFIQGGTQINGLSGRPTPSGAEQQAFRGALASTGAVGDGGAIFPALVDTEHEYLRWGYWSGEFRFDSDNTTGSRFNEREERYHLGTFVAGNRLQFPELPEGGTASFDGFAVVSVSEAGGDYVDGGSFTLDYDFRERSGDAAFRDLAGYDFEASVTGRAFTVIAQGEGAGQDSYAGTISANSIGSVGSETFRPSVNGTISGSFFSDASREEVLATAGRIDFQSRGDDGAAIIASGIFGGDGSLNDNTR